jgi:hypothetical protein
MTTHGPPDHRLDELRTRRAALAAERAAFEERRQHGLRARHETKLARLTAQEEEVMPDEPDNSTSEREAETDVA